jgi:hypothetical protein
VLFLGLIVPAAVVGAMWEAAREGWRAYHESDAWRVIAACFVAWILGDLKD